MVSDVKTDFRKPNLLAIQYLFTIARPPQEAEPSRQNLRPPKHEQL